MQIINSDFRKGTVKLRITDPEDCWYLSQLIDPGDFIKGKATRKIKIGTGDNAKVTRKTIIVKIEAESVDLTETSTEIKINGKIKEGPDDLPRDNYQSITLELGSEFILEKVSWLEYQKQKLKESTEKKYNYLMLIFDREEAIFALTKNFGYDILLKVSGEVPKKRDVSELKKDFQEELAKSLEVYAGRYTPQAIIVASPAFYKEDLLKKIKETEVKKKIVLATCSDVSERSLDEVLKRPELANTLKCSRAREEELVVDELLSEINKDNLAAYGKKEVQKAVDAGAVSKLLISNEFIKEQRAKNNYAQLDLIMKNVDALKGKIYLISSEMEAGKKLDGLGGIAVLTRYKLH